MSTLSESLGVAPEALPSTRMEAWRSMPLRALERRAFVRADAAPSVDAALISHVPAPRLVFVNGVQDATLSDLTGLDSDLTGLDSDLTGLDAAIIVAPVLRDESVDAASVDVSIFSQLAASAPGLQVTINSESSQPLHIVHIAAATQADAIWHQHMRIHVAARASGSIVEHQLAATPNAHFANLRLRVTLDAGAQLRHLRLQDAAEQATAFLQTDVDVAATANYQRMDLDLGGALSRHELNIRLADVGATTEAHGVLLGHGRRHAETRLKVVHAARDTHSLLQWRGLVADRSRVVFHGGIQIDEGADGSDAHLDNRNLLLSDAAEINTQPVLVIHAEEVKAAHGATVGQLDEHALFYLRTRGIPEPQARRILTAAFVQSLLSKIEDVGQRQLVERQLNLAVKRIGGDFEDTRA